MTSPAEAPRRGRQTPTVSHTLPYMATHGTEAADLYDRSGRTAQDWQRLMLSDIMAVDANGLWVHMKYGWSVPRRNGKSEILIMRCLWALTHGERVIYTAHRTTTSTDAWTKIIARLAKAGYVEDTDFKTYKTRGCERIEWLQGDSEALINFRTRSAKGGLGEGYDLLIIDEAQEYTADQETALKYLVAASPNGQTLMCGTPPTAVSAGDVFLKYRRRCLTGKEEDAGWAEWSVPRMSDTQDVALWYETNPSLGGPFLTERAIRSELGEDKVDDNIQRLGLWLTYSQKSAIGKQEWDACRVDGKPALRPGARLYLGVKFAKNTENVALAVAVRTADGRIFVEAIDCRTRREGNAWIIAYLSAPGAERVAVDGAAGQSLLTSEMKDAGVRCKPILPTVRDIIAANTLFEQQLFAGQICHTGQPALAQIAVNCDHRAIGSDGGFGYVSILEGAEAALLEAVSLAHWLCASAKEKKSVQVIGY